MRSITVEDFDRHGGHSSVRDLLRRRIIAEEGPYEDFVEKLYEDLDELIYSLQAARDLHQKSSEDLLSGTIILGLKIQGYEAVPDGRTGGHVDLSVKLGKFSWIGEAKKDGNFNEGFLQLTSRYVTASGNYAHNQGGLIFYLVHSPDAKGRLESWKQTLEAAGHQCTDCKKNTLAFYSTHKLEGPGTTLQIRTMGVSLFHKPQDKSARISAARKAVTKPKRPKPAKKSVGS